MSALFFEIVFKSSLLIGVGAAVSMLLKRRGSAATRHLVWTLVTAGVLLLPLFSISVPRWELKVPVPAATVSAARSTNLSSRPTQRSSTTVRPEPTTSPAAVTAVEPAHSSSSHPSDVPFAPIALLAVYGAGVLLFVARFVRQRRMVARLARSSSALSDPAWTGLLDDSAARLHVRHAVRLLRSCEHAVPMAFGARVPTIVVPAVADTWDDNRRRAVLLHELAHIVRRDCVTQMVAAITCALYWFHPGVWWTARRLRDESEIACDDCVLAAGTLADDYAGHLLELAYACVGHRAPALAVSMARSSEIESRLRAILDGARNRRSPALFVTVSAGVVAAIVLAIVAAARATMVPVGAQAPTAPPERATSQPGVESQRVDPATRAIAEGKPGAWEIWTSADGVTEIRLSERKGSWHSFEIDSSGINITDGVIRRPLNRDAGTFALEGVFRSGVGAGTFTFTPSQTFPSELAKRGYAKPTPLDQYLLARSDIGFAFIDELAAQNYARPDLALLVRAADHGVSLNHLREMGQLGYRLGHLEALITQVDHGVSPQFVRELRALGFTSISADDLVRTRDHGVDAAYIKALANYGFGRLTIEEAVRARNHGVDTEYVQSLRQLGYRLGLDELIRSRDHGIDSSYITDMAQLGYAKLSIEDLVAARDHGVDTQYVHDLRQLGYEATLSDLIKTRDHGVDAQYVRDLVALGYKGLSLEQMIRLRDHGVDAAYIRDVKTLGYNNPTPDDLVRLRDSGVSRRRLKVELGYQFERMRQRLQQVMANLTN